MTSRRLFSIVVAGLGLAGRGPPALAAGTDGKGDPAFIELAKAQPIRSPGRLEVIEFFWYGCPTCSLIEPSVQTWEKAAPADVVFRREHALWPGKGAMETHARLFVTLRAMNLLAQHHAVVFYAIHRGGLDFRNAETAVEWADRRGIDRAKFEASFKSPTVAAEVDRIRQMTRDYGVESVPTFIVNGKYATSPHRAGGAARMFGLIEQLIAKDRGGK